ncbi:MAG: AAA family ATPase [Alphaproteobacteria bacterium]|nr:AAA family ATPase [Alphaproteobacteria bacterium]
MSDDQAATIAFLAEPATHDGAPVERIDTHGAVVFLTPTRAYKLKRAVRFSYMDFSTVDRREAACRAELVVNRRTAPTLYLGVRSIVTRDGGLAFGDADRRDALDWVVVMRRFDGASQFDRLAAAQRLDEALVRRLAAAVAAFHRDEPAVRATFGGAEGLQRVVDENRHEFAQRADVLPRATVAAVDAACRTALEGLTLPLDRRRAEGCVRRCHGDLHLANICLVDGAPTLFDAIEFNDDIAIIDTLFDLAFLLMDLELRVDAAHANAALNAYLEILPEGDGLRALPLMLALRAGIRAHTRAAAAVAAPDAAARASVADDARGYLDRALGYLAPERPRLVAIGGVSGSGKTTLARALAPRLARAPGAVILRSDVVRKALAGVAPTERLGPAHYTAGMSARVYAELLARSAAILDAGRSVVVDAVHQRDDERRAIAAVAARAGLRFDGLWLDPDAGEAAQRIARRRDDASDATADVLGQQLARDTGDLSAWHRIDARGEPSQVAARAMVAIS